jgi:hypothetical protein
MENSPEFLKALEDAAEKAHREYLFGGIGAVAMNLADVEETLRNIHDRRRELEEEIGLEAVKRKVKAIKVKAKYLRKQANSMSRLAPSRYSPTPDWMSMTPEEIKVAEEKIRLESRLHTHPYHVEVKGNLKRKHGSDSALRCPCCGAGDHGNRMGGKPVCMMNAKHKAKGVDGPVPLLSPEEAEEWEPPVKSKPVSLTFDEPEGVMRWRSPLG